MKDYGPIFLYDVVSGSQRMKLNELCLPEKLPPPTVLRGYTCTYVAT